MVTNYKKMSTDYSLLFFPILGEMSLIAYHYLSPPLGEMPSATEAERVQYPYIPYPIRTP